MVDEEFLFHPHHQPRAQMLVEAMEAMMARGFRLQSLDINIVTRHLSPIRKRSISPESRMNEIDLLPCERFRGKNANIATYSEIAQKNAEALIKEEEEAKLKADKKKRKKKKNSTSNNIINTDVKNISNDLDNLESNQDDKDAEGLDINAAFVNKLMKKCKTTVPISKDVQKKEKTKDLHQIINEAIEFQNEHKFKEAIQLISEAISLAPKKYDLLLRRSFIHYKLSNFKKSIRDAQKVLELSANNPEAYFRLGEAHFAVKNLAEADASYTKLLNLNTYKDKVNERIFSIRMQQLEEMGYHPNEAYTAVLKSKNKTLDEAIDFLSNLEHGEVEEELYYSDEDNDNEDEEDEEDGAEEEQINKEPTACGGAVALNKLVAKTNRPPVNIDKRSKLFTDPKNPLGCLSIFVGNLKKGITYVEVENVFIKFGDIENISLSSVPNCYAFINYCESGSAGLAMEALQSSRWLLSTQPLLIKYPAKVIHDILEKLNNPEEILMKYKEPPRFKPTPRFKPCPVNAKIKPPVKLPSINSSVDRSTNDLSQPNRVAQKSSAGAPRPKPQTEECYFWRTTGCTYGNHCFNLHIPANKGIDFRSRGRPQLMHSSKAK